MAPVGVQDSGSRFFLGGGVTWFAGFLARVYEVLRGLQGFSGFRGLLLGSVRLIGSAEPP